MESFYLGGLIYFNFVIYFKSENRNGWMVVLIGVSVNLNKRIQGEFL